MTDKEWSKIKIKLGLEGAHADAVKQDEVHRREIKIDISRRWEKTLEQIDAFTSIINSGGKVVV